MAFDSLDDIRAFCRDLPRGDARAAEAAMRRQQNLTKPPGSLGRLEELAIWLAHWQGRESPRLDRVSVAVFAGNHGVAARGVSAYPSDVTAQMVANFAAGGAAINQIAKLAGADLRVVPIELDRPTRDFTAAAAMGSEVHVLVAGNGCRPVADAAAKMAGVAKVKLVESAQLEQQLAEEMAALVVPMLAGYDAVIAAASSSSKSYMPRVAAMLTPAWRRMESIPPAAMTVGSPSPCRTTANGTLLPPWRWARVGQPAAPTNSCKVG